MNIYVKVFLWKNIFTSHGYVPSRRMLGPMICLCLTFFFFYFTIFQSGYILTLFFTAESYAME